MACLLGLYDLGKNPCLSGGGGTSEGQRIAQQSRTSLLSCWAAASTPLARRWPPAKMSWMQLHSWTPLQQVATARLGLAQKSCFSPSHVG